MNCNHPQNNRFVHVNSQEFPNKQTVVRNEECLVCKTLLQVIYTNGKQVSVSPITSSTIVELTPMNLLPESQPEPTPEPEIVPTVVTPVVPVKTIEVD